MPKRINANNEERHGLGRLPFEDSDGGVDDDHNNIFDSVALPELPAAVDHHHHVDAGAAVHTMAASHAHMAGATMTQHGGRVVGESMTVGYAVGDIPALPPAPVPGNGAAGYTLPKNEVDLSSVMPMRENSVPPKWLAHYEDLKRYKDEHGDMNVPVNYESNKQLNSWIRTQKQQYKMLKEGKVNHMSQMRIDLLNKIGFEWAGEKRDKFWNDRYNELVAFHSQHGTTRIPPKYDAAPQLHTWVSLQRRQMKMWKEGKPSKLSEERIRMLEALGLECKIRNCKTWMDMFMELKRYKDVHGDCEVPQKWKENQSLGRWVDNQKTQHKKLYDGKPTHLTIERIQLLVSLGFNWRRG